MKEGSETAATRMDLQSGLKTALKGKYQLQKAPEHLYLPSNLCHWSTKNNFSKSNLRQHEFRFVDKSELHTWVVNTAVPIAEILSCDCKHQPSQRTVITVGVCGVGKTTMVRTCALEWAEGKQYQNIQLLFPLTFWELNLIKRKVSLVELLQMFYPELKELDVSSLNKKNVWFVLDGLDEFNMPLNFSSPTVSDISEVSKVEFLVTSLIKGKLLPNAHIWITARISAATQIPEPYVLKDTKLEGFTDKHKEQHIENIILNDDLSNKVLNHIKISRSLDFLSQIPPICTIMANVLKKHLADADDFKINPLSLTEIYSKLFKDSKVGIIGKLKELALHRLGEEGVMYESDLAKKDVSVREASAFAKTYPLVLRQEKGLHNTSVFRFCQTSIQEFMAASAKLDKIEASNKESEHVRDLVDLAAQGTDGELDVFLRFIFGLIKKRETLAPCDPLFDYTKKKLLQDVLSNTAVSLFHVLREYDRQALLNEVKFFLRFGFSPIQGFTPMHWTFMIQRASNFEGMVDCFDMEVILRGDDHLLRKIPKVLKSKKAMLGFSNLTDKSCPALAAVLSTETSYLRELDLGYNSITSSGIRMLVDGLSEPECRLKKLKLPGCNVSAQTCKYLIKALVTSCKLEELDLSRNEIGNTGVQYLAICLKSHDCRLEVLRLSQCSIGYEGCSSLASALQENLGYLKVLDLSMNMIEDKGAIEFFKKVDVAQLSKLELYHCGLTMKSCAQIGEVLKNESSTLVELNLSSNNLEDAGFARICEGMYAWCGLEKLNVARCGITSTGCSYLAKVLCSVSQLYRGWGQKSDWQAVELKELDISMNCLRDQGVSEIAGGLKNPYTQLKVLNLSNCNLTDVCCADLAVGLASKENCVSEINLSGNELQDRGVKKLCMGMRSPFCKLEKLSLRSCSLSSKSIPFLITALKSNPQHLTELLLMGNNLEDQSIKVLCELTKNQKYTLKTLDVSAD